VQVTYTSQPTLTLTAYVNGVAQPTDTVSVQVDQTVKLVATALNMPSMDNIIIYEQDNGNIDVTGQQGQTTVTTSQTRNTAQTIKFSALINQP
jgi:hypothetical protein